MTDYVQSTDLIGAGTQITLGVGDSLFVTAGTTVAGTGAFALCISGPGGSNVVTVRGDVYGSGIGIGLGGSSNVVTIGETGSVSGATGIAVSLGSGSTVINDGEIAGTTGISTGGGSIITNNGTIAASESAGIAIGDAAAGANAIVNTGTITGPVGISALSYFPGATYSISNSGIIAGTDFAIYCTGSGSEAVINAGTILGRVDLGDADDSFDNRAGVATGVIDAGIGNDTLLGGAGVERFVIGAGTVTVDGGAGDDTVSLGDSFSLGDSIDGGAGFDTVKLTGDYSAPFGTFEFAGIERIIIGATFDYDFAIGGDSVAAGETMIVDASALGAADTLDFVGIGDGAFRVEGGAANDFLAGGDGGDRLTGSDGRDKLTGHGGADRLIGGNGKDTYTYKLLGDSTGTDYDKVVGFNAADDKFDFTFTVTDVDPALGAGSLSRATFDADLAAELGGLGAGHAIVFTPSSGNLHGQTFLVVDGNGVGGYQANEDYVIALDTAVGLAFLDTGNFA
jgi:Ca2+-binding RTX toxin-like protein